tara:strand:+ start:751 stop:2658 length:1908 start_codon:yes stop_codon:yes gene_type:complete
MTKFMHSTKAKALLGVSGIALIMSTCAAFGFNEPTELADAVAAGDLPPVDERLPENPLVWGDNEWEPLVGEYGGTIHVATERFVHSLAQVGFARITADREGFVPDLAESFEWNDDFTAITFHMREGVRWSDGELFTADDIMFWWDDIIHSEFNEEPLPVPGYDTKRDKIVKVDDLTIRVEFDQPNPSFLFLTRGFSDGEQGFAFRAKHYWSQFHPSYTEVDGDPQQAFRELLDRMNVAPPKTFRVDAANVPVLYPWRPVRYEENVLLEMERNPYYWSVDAEGNQLPYVDDVTSYLMNEANPEQIKLRILAGEIDFNRRIGTVLDVPLYMDAAESAGIKLTFTLQPIGSLQGILFGYNNPDEKKRELIRNADFRRALSLAINRDVINETAALGLGRIGHGFSNVNEFDPEIDGLYAEYDPDRANALLDSIGLDNRDSEGFRTYPDGSPLTFSLSYVQGWLEGGLETVEATSEGWQDVGIRTNVVSLTHPVRAEREISGEMDAFLRPATGGLPTYGMQYGYGARVWALPQVEAMLEEMRTGTAADMDPTMAELVRAHIAYEQSVPFSEEFNQAVDDFRRLMADQMYAIGVVQDLPKIWIANANLMNTPGSETPDQASIILGSGDEEFPVRAFYFEQD